MQTWEIWLPRDESLWFENHARFPMGETPVSTSVHSTMAPAHKKAKTSSTPATAAPVTDLGGDDLDDNFLLDDEFAAGSDIDDPELAGNGDAVLSDDAGAAFDIDDEDGRPAAKKQKQQQQGGKKRAAVEEAGEAGDRPISKRAAKKANQRKREPVTGADDQEKKQDDMGLLPVEALADRLAEKQKKALPNLSALELDEQRIIRTYHATTPETPQADLQAEQNR